MPRTRIARKKPNTVQNELTSKESLIKTALELFSKHGFNGTSIRDIANREGMSVSNLYNHFADKESLWVACQEYSLRLLPDRLNAVWQEIPDPLERFKLLLKTHLRMLESYQKESKIFMMDHAQISKKANVRNRQAQIVILDIYVKHIKSLQQAGYIATKQTKILAFNMLGVINWYLRWYKADGALPAEDVFDEIVGFLLYEAIEKAKSAVTRRKPT